MLRTINDSMRRLPFFIYQEIRDITGLLDFGVFSVLTDYGK